MANTYQLNENNYFKITISDPGKFWSSPLNTNEYEGGNLPGGKYTVKGMLLDKNGVMWYQLNLPEDFYGTACFVPSSSISFASSDDTSICTGVTSSTEFKQYIADQQQIIYEESVSQTNNAVNSNEIEETVDTSVSAISKLVVVNNASRYENTSDTFAYYIEKTRTTFGLPPQWSERVDIRFNIPGTSMYVGRLYSQTIYANPTIISLTPGDIELVTDNSSLLGMLSSGSSLSVESIATAASDLGTGESFFRFNDRWDDYIQYLNEINKFITVALGASETLEEDEKYFSDRMAPADMFDESGPTTYRNIDFKNVLGSSRIISDSGSGSVMHTHWLNFAISGQITSQDSFSTSTRSTSLESLINSSITDIARDVSFMLGGKTIEQAAQNDLDQTIFDVSNELGSGFSGIFKAGADILKGGHIEFPQVVDDCAYGKTFSSQLRLVSPYGDIESRYLNTLLPYFILFCLATPRQMKDNQYDVYTYPFIVKASCKGIFACDSGVITRLEVVRGGSQEAEWTSQGHPTAIDIQLEITPLHSKLMQSRNDGLMIKNTGLQHYLSSICGVDVLTSTQTLMLETAKMLLSGGRSGIVRTTFDNVIGAIDKHIQSKLSIFQVVKNTGILNE